MCFDVLSKEEVEELLAKQKDTLEREEEDKPLCCAACRHLVTSTKERIAVRGAHAHTCTNPHGITFRIGCFRDAPGCGQIGQDSLEHTWFPGYAWRIALCNRCSVHLGWSFRARDGDLFFGLILNRLAGA